MMFKRLWCAAVVLAALTPSAVAGQAQQVVAQFTLSAKTAGPGAKVKGVVKLVFPDGIHAYQNPPSKDYMIPVVVAAKGKAFKLVSVSYPKGVSRPSAGEKSDVMVYEGTVQIPVVVQMPAKSGKVAVSLKVSWQACNEADCFQPEEVVVTRVVNVAKPTKKAK